MPPSPFHVLIQDIFEGQRLTVIAYRDRRAFIAPEIGRILGYGDFGRELVRQMNEGWAAEIRTPDHKAVLLGEELAAFKASTANSGTGGPQVDPRAPSVTLLTEQGLYRVLMLTGKPVGIRLRDWLDSDALPKIAATGGYGQPQIDGPAPEPKPLPSGAAELRRIGDRLWRAGKRDEATVCYLQAGEISLGRSFAPVAPAPAPVQVALPLAAPPRPAEPAQPADLWTIFVARWLKRFDATAIVSAGSLLDVVGDLFPLGDITREGKINRLNKFLMEKVGHQMGGYQLDHRRSTRIGYSLIAT